MALQYTDTVRNNKLTQVANAINAGTGAGAFKIYSGTPPADESTALSGNTLLATLTCSDPCQSSITGGVLTFNTITDDSSADATGTATFFRIWDSDSNVVLQGTVGTSGADLNMVDTSITAGEAVSISSYTITDNN